ncbi:hypothetical protein HPB50_022832 [Hyalomma asiaticum]|uniref:Uncharacterized protein n=1 Tax=Hyalomma asiaticum TaxID=266040 RepID=A0ACB7T1G8_HYAAI|nr:hypothetical protein HPB50_022832 [Hyalomma asiaticum]
MSGGSNTHSRPKTEAASAAFQRRPLHAHPSVGSWRAQDAAEANSPERSAVTVVVSRRCASDGHWTGSMSSSLVHSSYLRDVETTATGGRWIGGGPEVGGPHHSPTRATRFDWCS